MEDPSQSITQLVKLRYITNNWSDTVAKNNPVLQRVKTTIDSELDELYRIRGKYYKKSK